MAQHTHRNPPKVGFPRVYNRLSSVSSYTHIAVSLSPALKKRLSGLPTQQNRDAIAF